MATIPDKKVVILESYEDYEKYCVAKKQHLLQIRQERNADKKMLIV